MLRQLGWKAGLILIVLGLAVFYLIPPGERIRLGLDLQGGIHLVLEVEAEKAVAAKLDRYYAELRSKLDERDVPTGPLRRSGGLIEVPLKRAADRPRVERIVQDYPDLVAEGDRGDPPVLSYGITGASARRVMEGAVEQALETIRNRVDQFGVTEPTIQREGERKLIIQLPGIKDASRAKALIGRTAQLEFRLVDEGGNLEEALRGSPPAGSVVLYEVEKDRATGQPLRRTPLLVRREVALTGETLTDARVQIGSRFNEPYVSVSFDSVGAQVFDRVSGANVGRRLAIVLDGVVQSAPVIQERIGGGQAQITGRFTLEEAKDLAIALRAGALPAPVKVLEERNVGPSLGQDSVRTGLISIVVGGLLVVAFMALYYKLSGLVANLALLLNIILLLGVLGALEATLTLPGIAGIVLTVGMAVDANVLIFERVREELRLGRTVRAAVEGGYAKAFLTILDANVTTLIAAVVLFQFGTGPVKGFAVTLSLGIIASMFTAIFVTRVVFDFVLSRREVRRLSI